MTMATDVNWSTLTPTAPLGVWMNNGLDNAAVTSDATGPASPPDVFQITYPAGFEQGAGPVLWEFDVQSPLGTYHSFNEAFLGFWLKVSNPWDGDASNINKIVFICMDLSEEAVVLEFGGKDAFDFRNPPFGAQIVVEFPSTTGSTMLMDAIGAQPPTMTLNAWHRWECYCNHSTGALKLWFDGALIYSTTGLSYPGTGIGKFKFSPTWGGFGNNTTKAQTDHYWIDQTYFSVR